MEEIRDFQDLNRLVQDVQRLINVDVTFPHQVFLDKTWHCEFCSFDLCFGPALIHSCAMMAKEAHDDKYFFIMIEPHPVEYYFKQFGRFGAVNLSVDDEIDLAWTVFEEDPGNSPGDALMYGVDRFAVFAPSMRWAVWGSRYEETIICGASESNLLQAFSKGNCSLVNLDEALNSFLCGNEFVDTIKKNYPNT